MSLINHKAYLSGRCSINYDEIPPLSSKAELVVCDADDLLPFLSVLAAVVEGRKDFSAVLKATDVPDKIILDQKPTKGITIFSSGTTGVPKAFNVSWEKLMSRVSHRVVEGEFLASGYDKSRFAGLQGLLTCLRNKATFVDLSVDMNVASKVAIDRFIGTPSWFNFLLAKIGASNILGSENVKSITLGGEAADQLTISRLKKTFPNSVISQIFASSEAGVLFNVKDELAGVAVAEALQFEMEGRLSWSTSLLEMSEGDVVELLYFDDGKSKNAIPSGDFFKMIGGRLIFYGRDSDCITVGGQTVSLNELERVTNGYEGVLISRASSVSSSVMGSVLKIDIVLETDALFDKVVFLKTIRRELGSQYIPASIKFVDQIKLNSNGKVIRA